MDTIKVKVDLYVRHDDLKIIGLVGCNPDDVTWASHIASHEIELPFPIVFARKEDLQEFIRMDKKRKLDLDLEDILRQQSEINSKLEQLE